MLVDLVQNTLDGLGTGAAYALLALGFTLVFGVLRRANLSYGPAIIRAYPAPPGGAAFARALEAMECPG